MTLAEYLDTLKRYWSTILALTVIATIGAYVYEARQPNIYRGSATVLVSADRAGTASELVQGSEYVKSLVSSYVVMATSELVLQPVIEDLGLETTPRSLGKTLTVESPVNTVLIDIHAERRDSNEARELADAVAAELARAVSTVSPEVGGSSAVRVTTIQSAVTPQYPVSPNPLRSGVLGALAGLLLGVLVALVRRAIGGRVGEAADVASVSPAPVLGVVDEARRGLTLPAAVLGDPRSHEAESVRSVAANLHYLNVEDGLRALLVTSASPAEGKSSLSSALALILAETATRVLLVDADLRSPSLHTFTGLEPAVGLTSVLVGDTSVQDALQPWLPNLDVLTSGPVPPNPGQLLTSEGFRSFLAEARAQYEVVIVDTGPMTIVSDAVWLSHLVDGILVVARRGKTRTRVLGQVLQTLEAARGHSLGVILTRGRSRPASRKYGYGPQSSE